MSSGSCPFDYFLLSFFCLAQFDVQHALLTEVFGLIVVVLDEESFVI